MTRCLRGNEGLRATGTVENDATSARYNEGKDCADGSRTSAGRSPRAARPAPPASVALYAADHDPPSSNLSIKIGAGPRRPRHVRRGAVSEAVSAK